MMLSSIATNTVILLLVSVILSFHRCNANISSSPNVAAPAAFLSSTSFKEKPRNIPVERDSPHPTISKSYGANFPHQKYLHIGRIGTTKSSSSSLNLARYDNLLSGIAEISIGFSLGVLWSEYAIITTGCGPLAFSDTLERICYQGVIISAGCSIFCRIALGKDLTSLSQDWVGDYLEEFTLKQVAAAEILSLVGVLGAFVALGIQIMNGEKMDGLSGIDVEMCRAIRNL